MTAFWAKSRLISRAEATGNFRARQPLVTSSEGHEVGALTMIAGLRTRA